MKPRPVALLAVALIASLALLIALVPPLQARAYRLIRPKADIAARLAEYGPAARERMRPHFDRAGITYPPASLILVGLKSKRSVEVYAAAPAPDTEPKFIRSYPILAASGKPGPKLAQGDNQVPEGIYRCESLNPNSLYHLALRVGYPSVDDLARAKGDGRTRLGGDIMIHGGAASIGCLGMGDEAIEELFTLAADVGVERIEIILSPVDLRVSGRDVDMGNLPAWVGERYEQIRARLATLPKP